jgi:putative transposase
LDKARRERNTLPESITVDNGSEFSSKYLDIWAVENGVTLAFIRPRRPVENGFIESFNGRLRDEFLNVELLFSLADEQNKLVSWRKDFNDATTQRFGGSDTERVCGYLEEQSYRRWWGALHPENPRYRSWEAASRVRSAGFRRP